MYQRIYVKFDCCNISHFIDTNMETKNVICPVCYSDWEKFQYVSGYISSPIDGYKRREIKETDIFRVYKNIRG